MLKTLALVDPAKRKDGDRAGHQVKKCRQGQIISLAGIFLIIVCLQLVTYTPPFSMLTFLVSLCHVMPVSLSPKGS